MFRHYSWRDISAVSGLILLLAAAAFCEALSPDLPTFINAAGPAGIDFELQSSRTPRKYLIETMPGGVAMLDYNGDGLQDLFFVNGARLQSPMPAGAKPDKSDPKYWNRLYRNNGDGTFSDVTAGSGLRGDSYSMGVAVADYDNDGYPDLYVTNFGRNTLYHNNGNGTFSDVTAQAGVAGGGWSTSALFVDYDRDGRLDLFVARYLDWNFSKNMPCGQPTHGQAAYCHPDVYQPATYLLFHNNGDGTFTDVTARSGLKSITGRGLGSALNDYDGDGLPDILVANDAIAQQLFHNNGNGTFTEAALSAGVAYDEDGQAFSGMGVGFADWDNDGWPDIFVDALANQKYAFFHNLKGLFQYTSASNGLARLTVPHSGWGAALMDYDNDGWKDLFVAQSHVMDNIEFFQPNIRYLEPLLLVRNVDGAFEDVSARSGTAFQQRQAGRGAAVGDLRNNGSLDIVVSCLDGKSLILLNQGTHNHWITLNTVGTRSNRDGVGARIHLVGASGLSQYGYVSSAGSYLSANDKRVHFGLGKDRTARLIEISWPSGIRQTLRNVAADRILTVRENDEHTQ